ncbi:hypothetical protein PRK78_003595 [Emydomyces testavorans]|uniref:Uncharacterized protein n=1 Tax=Emydomyces testavorans TaxID=2070801 RepID=A0AAF0DH32_9EURO|nr:hypothetical protein PRK78_003595 [Emydomyces testavorans]
MGICASCLGLTRRVSHDSESVRLLDDDIYQPGYSYGTVHTHRQGPDPEGLKREREALDTICQRTSDSVIDIWAIHSQPLLPPARSASSSATASSSRIPSNERTAPPPALKAEETPAPIPSTSAKPPEHTNGSSSPVTGEIGGMKYIACRDTGLGQNTDTSTVPRHWGEVVFTNRREKKKRPRINGDKGDNKLADDLFGALVVS